MFYKNRNPITRNIKIVVTGGLGDCLLATPFIRYFKTLGTYDTVICIAAGANVELFDLNPYIDQLVPVEPNALFFWARPEKESDIFSPYIDVGLPEKGPDGKTGRQIGYLFDLNQVSVPAIRQVADYHGIELIDEGPEIYTAPDDEAWAEEIIKPIKKKPLVLINPESKVEEKNLPEQLCMEIENSLKDDYTIMYLRAGRLESPGAGTSIPLPGLRRSAALFRRVDCVITTDSFPAHLACSVNTKAIVLFGPSNPEVFGHKGNINLRATQCEVCHDTYRFYECREPRCIEEISAETVVQSLRSLLPARRDGVKI